ncbi:hypothetical protein SAMN05421740_105144 [Parapedobacter koreensis]|uniref:Uncharacterized protein n=1 Tax=Parapedobacter koreensis TaxID=332977 RepID=A0A1H7Q269_9SPHI|nr:hypothetical protein SAMN05421740_105144 [Parapedobacter koreensis]
MHLILNRQRDFFTFFANGDGMVSVGGYYSLKKIRLRYNQ